MEGLNNLTHEVLLNHRSNSFVFIHLLKASTIQFSDSMIESLCTNGCCHSCRHMLTSTARNSRDARLLLVLGVNWHNRCTNADKGSWAHSTSILHTYPS